MSKEIVKEFETAFEQLKKELKFRATLEELDEVFFLRDFVAKEGFVSSQLSRTVCRRMVDTFYSWYNYLHGLILPNPQNIWMTTESQVFNDKQKAEILQVMDKIMVFATQNTINSLSKNKTDESEFIDSSIEFWQKILKPLLAENLERTRNMWHKKSQTVYQPKKEGSMFG